MNFRQNNKRVGTFSHLDLTPMVDMVFNLLIFFALSLNFVTATGGINIKLPEASSAKPLKSENITINLTKTGKIYYNKQPVSVNVVKKKLRGVKDKSSLVIIRADDLVEHGKVVQVMDIAKSAGFSKLAIAVQKEGSGDK